MTWTCSHCELDLHLSGTLWRTDDESPFCKAGGPDLIAEQYAAEGVQPSGSVRWTSKMHAPRSGWIYIRHYAKRSPDHVASRAVA